jgi:spore germination protein YaaH
MIAGCSGYVAWYLFMPSNEYQDIHTYYELPDREVIVVLRDLRLDVPAAPVEYQGIVCFPVEFVKEYLDPYIFWDNTTLKLTVTKPDKVLRFTPGEMNYYENGSPVAADAPMYLFDNGPYMPAELLTQIYHISLDYNLADKIVTLQFLDEDRETAVVTTDTTVLRFLPDKKSQLSYRFSLNERVYVYSEEGDYTRVRTENGLLGFVPTKQIAAAEVIPGIAEDPPTVFPSPPIIEGKVNMMWDQVFSLEENSSEQRRQLREGLDVLSPTWFSFDINLSGDIISLADTDYVNWAHESGYRVWPLLSDFSSDTETVLNQDISHNTLTDTDKREYVINRLMEFIADYNLDGINIDFEYIQPEDAASYLQFIRELSPYMKSAGAVLSVDFFNPDPPGYWSKYYNRSEVAKVADYICVMAYDENIGGESGPNASMPYVRNGVQATLEEVPKEKVLLGVPYYVRVWKEEEIDGAIRTSSQSYDMETAYNIFTDNQAEITWDNAYGASFATYTDSSGAVYKAWLEDERSMKEKLDLMRELDLAGVAGWKRGLESDTAWELIKSYVN